MSRFHVPCTPSGQSLPSADCGTCDNIPTNYYLVMRIDVHIIVCSWADHFTTDVTSQVMRTAHKSQQGCGPDAGAKDGLSVMERAKQALVKANVEAARKRAHAPLSSVRAPFENKAPRCESGTSVRGSTTPRCGSEYKLEGSVQSQAQPRPPARSRPKPKPKPHKPLTDFEKTFGTIDEDDHEDDVKENERLQNMAGCMEWSMFSSECKRLAQQVCNGYMVENI